jgi:RecA/RadA recombinase
MYSIDSKQKEITEMGTFDPKAFLDKMKKNLSADIAKNIGMGDALPQLTAEDFMPMPKWWVSATKTPGLPYGRIVMLAGDTDSGKTSAAIQAIKAAQEQDVHVLYMETENKTTEEDFKNWGVDPSKVWVIPNNIAEKAYDALFTMVRGFKEDNPTGKLLVIIDSMGNVVSQRSSSMELSEDSEKPGEKGKINRMALEILISLVSGSTQIATLLINYTYDNIGFGHGKTNAGGKGPSQFSSLIYQTQRKGNLYKDIKGVKTKVGAEVVWTLYKNHLFKNNPGPHKVTLTINSKGVEVAGIED